MDLKIMVTVFVSIFLPILLSQVRAYPYEHHHEIVEVTEPSGEGYYPPSTRWRPPQHKTTPDLASIGMIVLLLKLVFLKAKGLGIGLILLLKLPIILIAFLSKLLVAVKAFKLAKILFLPLLIPLLLPLLLAPLLLLPLLLPLLLLLPVPVLATTAASTGRRRRRDVPDGLHALRAVVESEYCLERIACQMGASKQPSFYSGLIAWTLDKMRIFVEHPRFESYTSAYDKARNSSDTQKCKEKYFCGNPNLSLY